MALDLLKRGENGSALSSGQHDTNFTAIENEVNSKAGLASPALTGTPTVPTVTPATDSSTKIASTAFVQSALASMFPDFMEQVQDAVAPALTDTATIDLTYNDGSNLITADVVNASITDAKLRNSGALSVIGRTANTTGTPADITGTASTKQVLRVSGTTLGFGTVDSTYVSDFDEAAQDAVGAILANTATVTLTYTDGSDAITAAVPDAAITNAKLRDSGALSVVGRTANTTGAPADISGTASTKNVLRVSGTALGFGDVDSSYISDFDAESRIATTRTVSVADATSITPNASTTDVLTQANTQATGTLTVNAPTGTPLAGQDLVLRIKSTNPQTFAWNAAFRAVGGSILPTVTTGSSSTDYYDFTYNATDSKWDFQSSGTLPNSGVTPGSYTATNLTVDARGIITAASNGTGGGSFSDITVSQNANGDDAATFVRATNTSPTGNFIRCRNAGSTVDLFAVDVAGSVTVGSIPAARLTNTTGSGNAVLDTTPTLVTPVLGVATATSINKVALTAPASAATLTIANNKTLTASNSLTLAGTDATTLTFQGTDTYVGRTTTDTAANRLKNKDLEAGTTNIVDATDTTKKVAFTASGNSTGVVGTLAAAFTTSKTLTLPNATDTLVGKATTDVLTNKTFDTAGSGNSLQIAGTAITAKTGTGSVVLATAPTITDAVINQAANGNTVITSTRATDTSPTGNFANFKNAAGSALFTVDITGTLTAGTVGVARLSGTLAAAQFPAQTGDVTNTAGSLATTIAAGAVTEAKMTTADNTTNDVSTTKHGFAPKAPNDASKFLDGTGAYSQPGRRTVSIADATSVTVNADTTDVATQANTQATGTLTINAPTGTPVASQKFIFRLKSTNVQTFSWNAIFRGSTDLSLPTTSTGTSKTDYYGFIYNATDSKWDLLAVNKGY